MSNAFLFSGQGSQYPGMAKELIELQPGLKNILETGSEVLGFDLEDKLFNSDAEELAQTRISQPAIMATSLIACEAAKQKGIRRGAVAGHSLGEYAAMVESGMLSLEDGFKVIKARSEAMDRAAKNSDGAMCAILGLLADDIEDICQKIDEFVIPVNYNAPLQTVIAGTKDGINEAVEKFKAKGAKAIPLKVSAAFHSRLMQPAADEFLQEIQKIKFNKPDCRFYSNVFGGELRDFSNMPRLLATHMVSPVKFTSELEAMFGDGINTFIECGPGKVLTGLVKKTVKEATALNIENPDTLIKAVNMLY